MEKINNFKQKGGMIVWIEGEGHQAAYVDPPQKFLIHKDTQDVYRVSDDEWNNPPDGFIRVKGFYG
jgi:hypothetical protein